ncbi:MAG: magnesium transporter MgtE N-terminal domain-containing protein [Solirubrobacteraceae bacterium]
MAPQILHLSSLIRSPLVDRAGDKLGRVDDVIVRLDGNFPPVTGLKASIGGRQLFVPTDRIASLEATKAQLSGEKLSLKRFERRPGEVLLREDILGRKLIHVEAARLVPANDIALASIDGWWRVVGIDPSPRARLQRLLPGAARRDGDRAIIEWTQLEPFVGHVPSSRLRLPSRKLAKLHPAQIADLVEAASHEQGEEIIEAVRQDRELEADVFEELDDHHQVEFIRERPDAQVAQVLARMATDDAADLIGELDQERREPVLSLLPAAQGRQIRALLGYNPSTAGGLMSPEFVAVPETTGAGEALDRVRTSHIEPEALTTIYTTAQDGKLTGAIPVVALLRARDTHAVGEIATKDLVHVHTDADITEVARLMTDYNLTMLPVLDEHDQPVGVVTVDDVLELTLPKDWRRRFGLLAER